MSSIGEMVTGGAATLGVMAPYVMYLKRKLRNDRAEADMLAMTMDELKQARIAEKTAIVAMQVAQEAAARLEAITKSQAAEIVRRDLELEAWKRRVVRMYPETSKFVDSDYQEPPL